MEPFEDENPFETDADRIRSESSPVSPVDFSEPSSPPTDGFRVVSPPPGSTSTSKPTFPSPGSHRLPQPHKNDYCCRLDHWLHSGDDVEILVRIVRHILTPVHGR